LSEEEKEIVIDLSKRIKFGKNKYISIGTLLLSGLIALVQLLMCLFLNNWKLTKEAWLIILNLLTAIRAGEEE